MYSIYTIPTLYTKHMFSAHQLCIGNYSVVLIIPPRSPAIEPGKAFEASNRKTDNRRRCDDDNNIHGVFYLYPIVTV